MPGEREGAMEYIYERNRMGFLMELTRDFRVVVRTAIPEGAAALPPCGSHARRACPECYRKRGRA